MKKYVALLFLLVFAFSIYSCGGGQTTESVTPQISSSTTNTASFYIPEDVAENPSDITKAIIPFPNSLLFTSATKVARDGSIVTTRSFQLPTDNITDPATKAFYTAINDLQLEGFSPNTPITIPLSSDVAIKGDLQSNVKAIDMDVLVGGVLSKLPYTPSSTDDYCYMYNEDKDNETLAVACADTIVGYYAKTNPEALAEFVKGILPYIYAPLIVKQNGNVINAYPAKPFNPGHLYAVVLTNDGIDNLQASSVAKALMGDEPLTGSLEALEPLREIYVGLLPLIQTVGINKDNIVEMFTFSVAEKTLGLKDYAQISAAAKGLISPDNMTITGYEYSNLDNMSYAGLASKNEYLQFDALSDLPLVCQSLYDNATLRAYLASQGVKLPEITDNLKTYILTPNVYALSGIQNILVKYSFPVDQTKYPYVCEAIFDNATLYDNVTTAIYYHGSKVDNLTLAIGQYGVPTGVVMFQHGLGRDKSDAKILSADQNLDNYLFYAMDLPWHGGRIPPNPMFDSMASQCKTNGSCYLTSNPINDVMNIYQSLLDMHTFEKFIYVSDLKLDKELTSNLNISVQLPLYFLSQSMGSITGSMLLNIDNITSSAALEAEGLPANNYITRAILNVGGANYSAILNEATNPEIVGLLCSALEIPSDECSPQTVAKYRNTVGYNMTLALFQLVLDPVDPAFFARNPSIKDKIILQNAYRDTLVPNIANELLYNDYNNISYPYSRFQPKDVMCDSSNVDASEGTWYMFKGESPYDWINHGFLIHTADTLDDLNNMYPSAAGHMSLECVNNAEELSREQVKEFFTMLK